MASEDSNSELSTVYCTSCGEEISAEKNFCPECGSEQGEQSTEEADTDTETPDAKESKLRHRLPGISSKNTTRRNVLFGSGYAILGLGVLGAAAGPEDEESGGGGGSGGNDVDDAGGSDGGGSDGNSEQYPNAFAYDEGTNMVLRNVEAEADVVGLTITGDAVNESDQDYDYVQLEFGIYDSSDAKVGDGLANTNNLASGQTWRFEAIGTESGGAETFRLEAVTAY